MPATKSRRVRTKRSRPAPTQEVDALAVLTSNRMYELGQYPVLPPAEQRELVRQAHAGDREARDKLVLHNLRLVARIARRPRATHSLTFADLAQEGIFGLMRAITLYNPEARANFTTYAVYWIRQSVMRAIEKYDLMIDVPIYVQQAHRSTVRAEADAAVGATPRPVSERSQQVAHLFIEQPTSLDEPEHLYSMSGDRYEGLRAEHIPDRDSVLTEDGAIQSSEGARVRDLMNRVLTVRERQVLELRFGFVDTPAKRDPALRDVARILGISGERARQIETKALHKLRCASFPDEDYRPVAPRKPTRALVRKYYPK